jgi:hypothetical protein
MHLLQLLLTCFPAQCNNPAQCTKSMQHVMTHHVPKDAHLDCTTCSGTHVSGISYTILLRAMAMKQEHSSTPINWCCNQLTL